MEHKLAMKWRARHLVTAKTSYPIRVWTRECVCVWWKVFLLVDLQCVTRFLDQTKLFSFGSEAWAYLTCRSAYTGGFSLLRCLPPKIGRQQQASRELASDYFRLVARSSFSLGWVLCSANAFNGNNSAPPPPHICKKKCPKNMPYNGVPDGIDVL